MAKLRANKVRWLLTAEQLFSTFLTLNFGNPISLQLKLGVRASVTLPRQSYLTTLNSIMRSVSYRFCFRARVTEFGLLSMTRLLRRGDQLSLRKLDNLVLALIAH